MKRKWQRVLSWILTLTMLLGTFEGTGIGTLEVHASNTASVIAAEGTSTIAAGETTGNTLSAVIEFDQDWDYWGVIVYDELGLVGFKTYKKNVEDGTEVVYNKLVKNEEDKYIGTVNLLEGLKEIKNVANPGHERYLDLGGFFTVQAFSYMGKATDLEVAAFGNTQGTPVTFSNLDTVDNKGHLNTRDIYVVETESEESYDAGKGTGWTTSRKTARNAVAGDTVTLTEKGSLIQVIGSGDNISPITFAAKQGGSSDVYADVNWRLVGGQYVQDGDNIVFNTIDGLSAFVENAGEAGKATLCGLDLEKNADGTVTISGTQNKTITYDNETPVVFKLYAEKIAPEIGKDTEAQQVGSYEIAIAFYPMVNKWGSGAANTLMAKWANAEDDATYTNAANATVAVPAAEKDFRNAYVYDPTYRKLAAENVYGGYRGAVLCEFEAKENYQVNTEKDNNTVIPEVIELKNTSTITDMTNVKISVVNDGVYNYADNKWTLVEGTATAEEDVERFVLTGADAITTLQKNSKVQSFSVEPVQGLEALADENHAPVRYSAWLMIEADQLPVHGVRLAKINFLVKPNYEYTLKVGDEGAKKLDVLKKEWIGTGEVERSYNYIDLGAYQAANDIPDLVLTVSDSHNDLPNTAAFVETTPGVVTHLPGFVTGEENTLELDGVTDKLATISITGYLKPETYLGVNARDLVDFVPKNGVGESAVPVCYEDETNGWTVYLIPLKVVDGDQNNTYLYGKLTVKPAGILVTEEETDNVLESHDDFGNTIPDVSWYGSQDDTENKNTRTIIVKNTNKYAIKIKADILNTNFVTNMDEIVDDHEHGKDYITLAGGDSVRIVVGNKGGLAADAEVSDYLEIYGWAEKALKTDNTYGVVNNVGIDNFFTRLYYKALSTDQFRIIAPENEGAAGLDGKTLKNAKYIEIGMGDTKTWYLKSIGNDDDAAVEYSLAQVGDKIYPHLDKDPEDASKDYIVVTDRYKDDQDKTVSVNFVHNAKGDTTGLAEWGFSFNGEGQLRTYGPLKEGDFYFCVSANSLKATNYVEAYTYYHVHVGASKQAIIVTSIDNDDEKYQDKEKVLEATAADGDNYTLGNYSLIADDYNFVINTTTATRESISKNFTIKNNTNTVIEDLTVTWESVNFSYFDKAADTVTWKYTKDLNRNESIQLPVNFIAMGVKAFNIDTPNANAGLYVEKVTIRAKGVADKVFYVKTTVKPTPSVVPFVQNKDYHATADYNLYKRPATSTVPAFNPTYSQVIAGEGVAVGKEITKGSLKLTAKDSKGNAIEYPKCNFTWAPTSSIDPEIDGELVCDAQGNIYGTPTHPGVYYMTVTVSDISDSKHAEYGYFDLVVIVPGSIDLTITTKGEKVVDKNVVQDATIDKGYTVFDGVVKGDNPSARKEFTILNKDDEKTLTGLKVTMIDTLEPKEAGGRNHFSTFVVNDQTSIPAGETATFVVAPFDSSAVGDYVAYVKIEADQIAPIEIPVAWSVVARIELTAPSKAETTVPVGQPFDLTLVGKGGHSTQGFVWKAMEDNDDADDNLLKKFAADMSELNINKNDFAAPIIKDHAITITKGKMATPENQVLKGAGTKSFTASANIPASKKMESGTVQYPEQYATENITIMILATTDVYIFGTKDNTDDDLQIGKSESEEVVVHDIRDKNNKITDEIETYWKKTSFTYRTVTPGYPDTFVRTFTLKNALTFKGAPVDLQVSANVVKNGVKSEEFTITAITSAMDGNKIAGQKFRVQPGSDATITVKAAHKLPKGTYTADLVIAGQGIETITLPLSFTVEDPSYEVTLTDSKPAILSGNTITKDPLKRNDTKDDKPALVRVYATGNQSIIINKVVELRDDNKPFPEGATGQKFVINSVSRNGAPDHNGQITYEDKTYAIKPVADPAKPGKTDGDQYIEINLTVKDFKSLSDNSAKVRVYYRNGANVNDQDYVDVTVNYVVYEEKNTKITYTPDDTFIRLDEGKTVLEGYDPKDHTKEIKIHNGEAGDLSKGVYYMTVASSNPDNILVNGKASVEIKLIEPGETVSVFISPVPGLAKGAVNADITFTADNGRNGSTTYDHKVAVDFQVDMNENFATVVRRDQQIIASGFKARLFDTLTAMVGSNDTYRIAKHQNDITKRDEFLIDLNPNAVHGRASQYDIYVTADEKNNVIIRKATKADDWSLAEAQRTAVITTDVTTATTVLDYAKGDGKLTFKKLSFTIEETITYREERGGENVVTWYVPYGSMIKDATKPSAFDPKKIAFKNGDKALEGFVDEDTDNPVDTDDIITDDHYLVPVWHTHVYAINTEDPTSKVVSGNVPGVEWVWTEDGNGGYSGARVFLTCVSDKCNDPVKGVVSADGILGKDPVPGTCTVGGYTMYTAVYLFPNNGITYTSEAKGDIIDGGCGHNWQFDWDNVRWDLEDLNAVSCNVIKTCQNTVSHNELTDGPKSISVSADKIEFIGTQPTCTEPGHGYLQATFTDPDIPAADIAAGKNVVSQNIPEMPATKHKWSVSECTMEGSFDEGAKSAVLYLVCENDPTHTASMNITDQNITLVSSNAVSKTYMAQGIKDNQTLNGYYTFWNHTEHVWSVSWNWVTVTSENAVVKAIFTCEVGGEIVVVNADVDRTQTVETYTWTAKAVGPDGKEVVASRTFNRETNEEITHDHVWSEPEWDWSGTTSQNAMAKAIFTCSANGVEPHQVKIDATITEVRTATNVTYTAKVTGPDNKEYTDTKLFDLGTGKEITHEDHVWSKPVWDWTGTTSENGVAKATFNCTKTGEEHSVVLNATVTEKSRKANKVVYVATVSSPAPEGKEYKDSCTVTWNEKGEIKVEPGKGGENEQDILEGAFTVIGVEPEYAYTGTRIKPAVRVIDNERDVELGIGTDFTVSYTGKNKIGETNIVKIKGKGNYGYVNNEIKFKIIDPRTLVEGEDLAASVKSIAKISDAFVYDGTFKYPASITVNMKDKSTIVFTHDGDGEYSHEGDKTVALSFCNNKNKGTAYVAATGSDGKTKKKGYKIAAANIASASFVAEDATWAVKPEEVKIEGTYGEDELALVAGGDFKVKYVAKNAKNVGENVGVAQITGKGNFKGKATVNYTIEALELSEKNIVADASKAGKTKVYVVDNLGNKLNKKLYTVSTEAGEGEVTVTVTATGNATTGDGGVSVTVAAGKANKLSKAKFKAAKGFAMTYTGEAIELTEEEFGTGKIETALSLGTDFEIVCYSKNLKKGTMKVTLVGTGEYSGIKTISVKIAPKKIGNDKK